MHGLKGGKNVFSSSGLKADMSALLQKNSKLNNVLTSANVNICRLFLE